MSDHPVAALGHTAVRPEWTSVPDAVRRGIASRLGGHVEDADSQSGGFTPGLAVRLRISGRSGRKDRVFVKAAPADHPVANSYRSEAAVAVRLPAGVPRPRLRWHGEVAGWVVLCYDDVDGRHADFTPPGTDMPAVIAAVSTAQIPAPGLPDAVTDMVGWLHGWEAIASGSPTGLGLWEAAHLDRLVTAERAWMPYARGTTVVHGDLRPDNILIISDGAVLVDWTHALAGEPWIDLATLIPQLIIAGHRPEDAERHFASLPAWRAAPPDGVTGIIAALAGYWTRSARQPPPLGIPHLRGYQTRAAEAAVRWLISRMKHV
jgi:hypothetical protein